MFYGHFLLSRQELPLKSLAIQTLRDSVSINPVHWAKIHATATLPAVGIQSSLH
jgi:hypothetical protein